MDRYADELLMHPSLFVNQRRSSLQTHAPLFFCTDFFLLSTHFCTYLIIFYSRRKSVSVLLLFLFCCIQCQTLNLPLNIPNSIGKVLNAMQKLKLHQQKLNKKYHFECGNLKGVSTSLM